MKKALPANAKIAEDAKETIQECVSEFISFITSKASDKCQREKRKTINGDDLLWAMTTLGFEDYIEPLKLYLQKYREMEVNMTSNPPGESYNPKRPIKNKHQWSAIEDAALIEALMQLNNAGDLRNKNEKGFRPGHELKLQQMLEVSLPGHGIKSKPHIESRLRTFQKLHNVAHDMLYGAGTSGFGWDSEKKLVTAKNSVWGEYIKTQGDAEQFRYKSLAYYEELSIIFGRDRASGKDVQVPTDIVEELDKVAVENDESIGVDGDYASYAQDFIFGSSEENSKPKRKKTESTKDLSRVIREATTILGEELNNASNRLIKALEYDEGTEKRMQLNEVLTKLPGLSMLERHKATRKIGCDRETTDIFFTIPDDEKEVFVKALLSGDI